VLGNDPELKGSSLMTAEKRPKQKTKTKTMQCWTVDGFPITI
jgi:hypothetical protein